MFSLKDKKVLITGATGGIGEEITKMFHQAGAHVAISGTREEALNTIKNSLGHERIYCLPCNLGDADQTSQLVDQAVEQMGGLDILINNAGITKDGLLMRMKDEDWDKVIDINLTSVFRLCRNAIKFMMQQRHGRIINISSIVGVTGNAGQCNYAASKAGLIGFTKSLAQEMASRNITANVIAPGFIETPMTDKLSEAQKESLLKNIPLKRMGTPQDIAAAAFYLASDEASYVTGATLNVNGGMAMI